eukprot:9740380-Alexandrium_andersonii.AAC.1
MHPSGGGPIGRVGLPHQLARVWPSRWPTSAATASSHMTASVFRAWGSTLPASTTCPVWSCRS